MVNGESWIIEPLAMFTNIVHPSFTGLIPGTGAYDGMLYDFVVMDNVPYKRPIVDIYPAYNILQPRDASCELVYKQIGTTGLRDIETRQIYGATKNCKHQFYQGALRDWANDDMETFGSKITPFFLKACQIDMATNCWFGDIARPSLGSYSFSVGAYDGIVKWIQKYIALGTIPASQTFVPAATNYRDPAYYVNAYQAIDSAWKAQSELMQNWPDDNKIIYVDKATLDGYRGYIRSIGTTIPGVEISYAGGLKTLDSYNGIAIQAVPLWAPVLNSLLGAGYHHMVILTVRQNFLFATDKDNADQGGENGKTALNIFYWQIDMSFYYQQFMLAGTQIALPEFIVFGISA